MTSMKELPKSSLSYYFQIRIIGGVNMYHTYYNTKIQVSRRNMSENSTVI